MWKNIWATRGLLQYGLCWRVGSSEKISIIEDAWIPRVANYRLINNINNVNISIVSELIDANNREWK